MTSDHTPSNNNTRDISGVSGKNRCPNPPLSDIKSSNRSTSPSKRQQQQHRWEDESAVLELDLSSLSASGSLYIPSLETITEDPRRKRQHHWDEEDSLTSMDFSVLSMSTSDLFNPQLDTIDESEQQQQQQNKKD